MDRRRLGSLVLAGALGALFAAITAVSAYEASVRWRVDTPVEGVAIGSPGCVTAVRFVAADGTSHSVDVRGYKAGCARGAPGDRVTVWYDAADPRVNAPDQRWWPYLVLAVVPAFLTALAGRTAYRSARGRPAHSPRERDREGSGRGPGVDQVLAPSTVRPPAGASRGVPDITDENAGLYWDWTTGRLEVLIDRVAAELAVPASERHSVARDGSLTAVRASLERTLVALRHADSAGAARAIEEASRIVVDEWDRDSPLGQRVLAVEPYVTGVGRLD